MEIIGLKIELGKHPNQEYNVIPLLRVQRS